MRRDKTSPLFRRRHHQPGSSPGLRLGLELAGVGVTAVLLLVFLLFWQTPISPPTSDPAVSAPGRGDRAAPTGPRGLGQGLIVDPPRVRDTPLAPRDLAGRWAGRVRFEGGAEYDETFDFSLRNGKLSGTVTHSGLKRPLEQVDLSGRRLTFVIHSRKGTGAQSDRRVTHRYVGVVERGGISFTRITTVGDTPQDPVDFMARRVDAAASAD